MLGTVRQWSGFVKLAHTVFAQMGDADKVSTAILLASGILVIAQTDSMFGAALRGMERFGVAARLLELLGIAGTPFDTICARLVERLGQSDGIALAGSLLAQWAQDGLLMRPEENTP